MALSKGSLILLSLAATSFGQVHLNGFLAVPIGDYASSSNGMAQTGFGLSMAYMKPLTPELSVGGEGGFILNKLDVETFAEGLLEDSEASEVSAAGGTYFNTPALVTVLYSPKFYSKYGVSFYAGLGIDFLYMMDVDMEVDGSEMKATFDPGPALAWGVGWQMELWKHTLFGVRYLDLGEHTVKGKFSSDSGDQSFEGKQKVGVVNLVVGYRF